MKLRRALPILGVALVVGGIALWSRKRKPPAPPPEKTPLAVQFSGCARVERGPVCFVEETQRLTLVVASSSSGAAEIVAEDGSARTISTAVLGAGTRYIVELSGKPTRLIVAKSGATYELSLRLPNEPLELQKARGMRAAGDVRGAEAVLRNGLHALAPEPRGRRLALLARILIARGEREEGQRLLREALDSAEQLGRLSDAVEDALALAHGYMMYDRRFTSARELLLRADRLARDASGLELTRVEYYAGVLADATSDRGVALDRFRNARDAAVLFDIHPLAELVTHQLALTLANLGRVDEALPLLRAAVAVASDDLACNRATMKSDLVWLLRLAYPENPPAPIRDEAKRHLAAANALLKTACTDPIRRLDAQLTEAEWALAVSDAEGARKAIESAAHYEKDQRAGIGLWRLDVDGRQKLLSGNAKDARVAFAREAELAKLALDLESQWRSHVGLGKALEGLNREEDAIRAYREAESALDRMLVKVPLGEGRDSFAGARDEAAKSLVALLIRVNRPTEAFGIARAARTRSIRAAAQVRRLSSLSPAERERWDGALGDYRRQRAELEADATNDWQLASDALAATRERRAHIDVKLKRSLNEAYQVLAHAAGKLELEAPGPGELLLAYFPTRSGFVGFAATSTETIAKELGTIDITTPRDRLAEQLLTPFASAIDSTTRVRILAYDRLRSIDLHALPFRGVPLSQTKTVEYALDLGTESVRSGKGALLVTDPKADLPQAKAEGVALERILAAQTSVQHTTGESATRSRVLEGLGHVRWFHFAGHGVFAGVEGSESAIDLSDGRITVGDVLALPRVPELLVLNACDAARSAERVAPESYGLAQAFLVRGARGVIAPTRPVSDELARYLATELYAELRKDDDPAAALGRASKTISSRNPGTDWAAFRTLSP
jgi:tetratricopeptide (TPR) repeat protein